jgi:hypothetical protein
MKKPKYFCFVMPLKKERTPDIQFLRFSFLVLGPKILVTALAAARCADGVACITMHAYLHVE